ncbi:MAG: sigma-70 family RNA polymerase sigma factor [Anaerolineae bacterium]
MKSQQEDPDLPLLERIAAGDPIAFERLYHKHRPYLFGYLLHLLNNREAAEETLQNLMMAIWRGAGRFRHLSRVRTWMIAIARRQALKTLRRSEVLPLDEAVIAADEDVPTAYWQHAQIDQLREAVSRLSASDQELLELVYYEDLTLGEAASQLGIPVNTAKSRLHRIRQALRKSMMEADGGSR